MGLYTSLSAHFVQPFIGKGLFVYVGKPKEWLNDADGCLINIRDSMAAIRQEPPHARTTTIKFLNNEWIQV